MGSIAQPTQTAPKRVYLLTSPRTASNLLVRMINAAEQPNVEAGKFFGGYFFMPAYLHRMTYDNWHLPIDVLPEAEKNSIAEEYHKCATVYKEHLDSCEQSGKIAFVKEHFNLLQKPTFQNELIHKKPSDSLEAPWSIHVDEATDKFSPSNPTILPDNVLLSFKANLLIRHPAIQFPSLMRASDDAMGRIPGPSCDAVDALMYQYKGIRALYDFIVSSIQRDSDGSLPLIIDAADFIQHPATVLKEFCDVNGFSLAHCKFNWEVMDDEILDKMKLTALNKRMLSSLNASTGIDPKKAMADVDIDVEAPKWRKEFGEEKGRLMEKWVREAMPDYLYLWEKRWDPVGKDEN